MALCTFCKANETELYDNGIPVLPRLLGSQVCCVGDFGLARCQKWNIIFQSKAPIRRTFFLFSNNSRRPSYCV